MNTTFSTEVIVTTYNNSVSLELALTALSNQELPVKNICIADDGSNKETKVSIDKMILKLPQINIRHLWQPDTGFNKNTILNEAIATSEADYLIFIDGDCISCPNFVQRHFDLLHPNTFITGSVIRLDAKTSSLITVDAILEKKIFTHSWLLEQGQIDRIGTKLKTNLYGNKVSSILEYLSPVKKVWNGGNTSAWRNDLIKVNGFDESLRYGAEDVELGVRLNNIGVFGRHIRYSAPLLHLDHPRGYVDKEQVLKNKNYVKLIKKQSVKWTNHGICSKNKTAGLFNAHQD